MEIYICYCCGYPIIFRDYMGHRHQVIHLPTGWPCWQMQEAGSCDAGTHRLLSFPATTKAPERVKRLKMALSLYEKYLKTSKMAGIMRFVKMNLRNGKSDIVRDLLKHLVEDNGSRDERNSLVYQIVVSDDWKALHERLRKDEDRKQKQAASAKKQRRR
jgi:hypothetical protein